MYKVINEQKKPGTYHLIVLEVSDTRSFQLLEKFTLWQKTSYKYFGTRRVRGREQDAENPFRAPL